MNDPYHVYMDLDVVNNDYNATNEPQLRFEEPRSTPFLSGDSADYFCSVVHFNIQTGSALPVFIAKIEIGQRTPTKRFTKLRSWWMSQKTKILQQKRLVLPN